MRHRDWVKSKESFVIANSNSLILGMNRKGKIDMINQKMVQFLDLGDSKVIGEYAWQVKALVKDENKQQLVNLLFEENETILSKQSEIEIETGNNNYVFTVQGYQYKNDGFINGKVFILNDISSRKAMENQLKEMATTDPLTSLYNRRFFEIRFKDEIIRSERYQHDLSLMMIDVDYFKQVNDQFGHHTGDIVLKELADSILRNIRNTDICARIGGEEIAVLLPETSGSAAMEIAERVREGIARNPIEAKDEVLNITVSIGVTTSSEGFDQSTMYEQADKALYKAKESGRNRTETIV
jgi:diguanylate cyclase (GGDEF)-like protein